MADISAKLDATNPRTVTMTFVVKHEEGTSEEKVFLTSFSSIKAEAEPVINEAIIAVGPITTITHDEGGAHVGELTDDKIKKSINALNPFASGGRRTKHRKLRGGKKSMRRYKKNRKH